MGIGAAFFKGLKSAGSEWFLKNSTDPDFLQEQLEKYLKEHLNQTNPDLFMDAFEKNVNITECIPAEEIEFVKRLSKDDPNMPEIKRNILKNLNNFGRDWIMDWLFKNAPEYYQVIATHPKRTEFEIWIAAQISNIGKFIVSFDV